MNEDTKLRIALWRFSLLGPLVSARREHGDLRRLFEEAAARTYESPDGRMVRIKVRTFEDWYYSYKSGGLKALEPRDRSDKGKTRAIETELASLILAAKRERPRRSIRRIIKILVRAKKARPRELTRSSVHRLLQAHGVSERPPRHLSERRSFRMPFPGDLWMGDVMHGPPVWTSDGRERKAYLHLFIDSATRFVTGCAFRLGETAADLEAVLRDALLAHGVPRTLYVDRGAAQTSLSLRVICAELGIRLLHCKPYDPAAKGSVERIFRTLRDELLDEVEGKTLELGELNGLLWSWLSVEYHRRLHDGTGEVPHTAWLAGAEALRQAPRGEELARIFLHRQRRRVRKDGTVKFEGRLLEVRGELSGRWVELRFEPHSKDRRPQVFVDGKFYCDTADQDLIWNSRRRRRLLAKEEKPAEVTTGLDPLGDIQKEHERRSRPTVNRKPKNDKE